MTETIVEDTRVEQCREEFNFIQANMDVLVQAGIEKALIMEGLKSLRDTITAQRKHHPKIEHVFKEVQNTNPRRIISLIQAALNTGRPMPDAELRLFTDLMTFVSRFVKNFPDMFLAAPATAGRFMAECIEQFATEWSKKNPSGLFSIPHDETRYAQMHEKYLKDWQKSEEEKPQCRAWITDYFKRNGYGN